MTKRLMTTRPEDNKAKSRSHRNHLCLCTGKIPPEFGALQLWIKL
jgi:hypothetical protein